MRTKPMRLALAILVAAGLAFFLVETLGTAAVWAGPAKECCL
jgi:hypothetical protein